MAERQEELLGERVHHRKRRDAVVVRAIDRLLRDVAQGVVHPPHVPLEAESEAPRARLGGDPRPRRRLLRDHDDAGAVAVARRVDLLEERDRVEILAPAVDVGAPLAGLAGVVEVEHGSDRVDAQAVDVEFLEPIQGVRDKEVSYLRAPEVEDERSPLRLFAAKRVRVLVERGAVEARERPLVSREVARHPVEEDADACLVKRVDEEAEVVGGSEPRRRRVVRGHLVAPRSAERVFRYREELDVGEARLARVVDELLRELTVGQAGFPRAEVNLVDAHGLAVRRPRLAGRHPRSVPPHVGVLRDDGGSPGWRLRGAGHRVRLLLPVAVAAEDLELVAGPGADPRDEELPDPRGPDDAHGVQRTLPVIEVPRDPHDPGVRRPHGERRSLDVAEHGREVSDRRSQGLPQPLVPALPDEVQVEVPQGWQESVGVVLDDLPGVVGHVHPVVGRLGRLDVRDPDAFVLVRRLERAVKRLDADRAR